MKKLQRTMDKITTLISSILCAAMMIILFANVVLRLIPSVGGFKWYMESSQYLNVWSMLIACIGINAMGTNLRVEVVDSIFGRTALGKKLVVLIQILECILTDGLVAWVAREVESDVLIGQLDCLGAAVHGVNRLGIAAHGID